MPKSAYAAAVSTLCFICVLEIPLSRKLQSVGILLRQSKIRLLTMLQLVQQGHAWNVPDTSSQAGFEVPVLSNAALPGENRCKPAVHLFHLDEPAVEVQTAVESSQPSTKTCGCHHKREHAALLFELIFNGMLKPGDQKQGSPGPIMHL